MISINRKDLPEPNTTCQTCGHKYYVCNKCLKLRTSGIETWRQYCDCIECYQLYVFLGKDVQDIDKEEYEHALAIELPDGKQLTKEAKAKMDAVKKHFTPSAPMEHPVASAKEKVNEVAKGLIQQPDNKQGLSRQQGQQSQNKPSKKNGSNSKYLFNNKTNNNSGNNSNIINDKRR